MNEPRPRITSARPFEIALSVEKRWKTRTGSSVLSTVTAEPRQDARWSVPAIAASMTSGAEIGEVRRDGARRRRSSRCPTWSASTASSTTSRSVCACDMQLPVGIDRDVAERVQTQCDRHEFDCSRERERACPTMKGVLCASIPGCATPDGC